MRIKCNSPLTNLRCCEMFVFALSSFSSVFVTRYCRYGFSVTERLVWSTLKGLFMCILDVVRVKLLFTLVLISVFFRTIPTNTDYRQC